MRDRVVQRFCIPANRRLHAKPPCLRGTLSNRRVPLLPNVPNSHSGEKEGVGQQENRSHWLPHRVPISNRSGSSVHAASLRPRLPGPRTTPGSGATLRHHRPRRYVPRRVVRSPNHLLWPCVWSTIRQQRHWTLAQTHWVATLKSPPRPSTVPSPRPPTRASLCRPRHYERRVPHRANAPRQACR